MAIKLRVQSTEVKLKIAGSDTAQLKASEGIAIYPDPYTGETEVTPTEEEQTLSTSGLMVVDDVTVHAIPSTYVGSGIDRRSEDDLTASADSVSVPAGYYEESATKSVGVGSATTPTMGIEVTPTISVNSSGVITATATKSESVLPVVVPGYVGSGTAGTITFSGSNTSQLSTQGASTITPTESEQTAVTSGKYTTGTIKVGAISSSYVGSGITRRDGDDLSASGATVSVPSGYYAENASKSVATGNISTPYITKGTVTNNSVTMTPYYTRTAGYIAESGTYSGTQATVTASELVSGTKSITANDTDIDVTNYAKVDVSVSPTLQTKMKSYTPSETAQSEDVTADNGYDGLSKVSVSVGAISSTYVGSGVTRRDSTDLSASGATVTAPSGYYAESATKTLASGSATPAASISASSASKSIGNGSITLSKTVSNTPQVTAGYVSSGTAGNTSVSLTASVTTQGAQTIHPSTSDQTIGAATYTTGVQTFKGVTLANLSAGNIKDGVTIKVGDSTDDDCVASVTGTYTGGGGTPNLQTKTNINPTTSSQTITYDTGYDGLDSVQINAMPSGTAGTPTASKGTVSNHAITVTPSVTNTTGYITGGTKTGTGVSVSASELVSGTLNITSSGTKDVTNYANASVSAGTEGTPTATKGTVSNHSISVTPSVTNSAGYINGSTKTGTAVTVSASELVSGSETKTANGTYDVTNLASLVVNVSGGTSKNTQVVQGTTRTTSSTMTAIGAELTVSKTGTYDIYWSAFRSSTSSSYTYATQLYIDNTAYGSENSTWSNNCQNNHLTSVSLTINQKLRVRGRNSRNSSYYIYAPMLVIVEN